MVATDARAPEAAEPESEPERSSDLAMALAAEAKALATVDPTRAIALSDRAEAAAKAAHDWRAVSVARRAHGVADLQLRQLDSAVGQLRGAVQAARRVEDAQLTGEARMSLGAALMFRGQPAQGLTMVGYAVDDLRGLPAARARTQRSAMLQFLGRTDEAMTELRTALPVLRREGDAEWEVRALSNRSTMYVERRQLALAEADLVRTLELAATHGLTVAGAYARQNLGCVYLARGEVPSALEAFARAADLYDDLGIEVGSLMVDRATALLGVRLLEEARTAAEAAVRAFEEQHRAIELPEAQLIVSTAALLQGDTDAAIDAASAAAKSLRRLGRTDWLALARYAELQARLAPPGGIDEDAGAAVQLGVPSSRVRAVADQLQTAGWLVPALEARVLASRTALLEGRPRAARRDLEAAARARKTGPADARARAWVAEALLREAEGSRGGAKRALRTALRIVDDYRLSLGATELRAHVSVHRSAPARIGLRLALEDGDPSAVHWWAERRRATADLLRPALPPSDPALAGLLEDLRATMAEIEDRRGDGQSAQPLVARQVQLETRIRDFARRHPLVAAQSVPPVELRSLAADLGEQALVEYVDDGAELAALTLVNGRSHLHPLGPSASVRNALRHLPFALRRAVQPHAGRVPTTASAVIEHATEVFQSCLLDPLMDTVADRPLLVVPTGWLQGLPWSMLRPLRGRPITVAPSATLWRTARDRASPGSGSVVVVAGPGLPGASAEALAVAGIHPGATLLTGRSASSSRLGAVIGDATTCHIAAHGTLRPDNPLFSSLLLDDGPLTVLDLEQIGGTPRHVVLAACDSGISKVTPGQEILGLTATLLARQTATVVAPIVSIDDAETTELMVGYHRRLSAGAPPAQALAEQQAAHGHDDLRARVTAGAFVCLGVGDQLPGRPWPRGGSPHRVDPVTTAERRTSTL